MTMMMARQSVTLVVAAMLLCGATLAAAQCPYPIIQVPTRSAIRFAVIGGEGWADQGGGSDDDKDFLSRRHERGGTPEHPPGPPLDRSLVGHALDQAEDC